jgi:cytochrome c553
MKKVLAGVLAVASLAAAGSVYAGIPAQTGVNGSLHDMRQFVATTKGQTYAATHVDSMDRVCVFCHTPHNSTKATDSSDYPLWNHDGTQTLTAYQPYVWATELNKGDNGVTADFTIIGNQAIIGPSRLCLTCHDGNIAVDQHNGNLAGVNALGNTAQAGSNFISDRAKLGTDLTDDHPIGFDYNAIQAYRELHSAGGADAQGNKEIVASTETFAIGVSETADTFANQGVYNIVTRQPAGARAIKDVLYQGKYMTCATCHEVHNKDNAQQAAFTGINGTDSSKAPNYFLYAPEEKSLICLSCHVK